jgi:hypothetical protein
VGLLPPRSDVLEIILELLSPKQRENADMMKSSPIPDSGRLETDITPVVAS